MSNPCANFSHFIVNYTIKILPNISRPFIKIFFSLFIYSGFACSPAIVMLDYKPEWAKSGYKYFVDRSEQNIEKDPDDHMKLLDGCESITKYAFGFIMEKADRISMNNYSEGKILYYDANNYFERAVKYCDRSLQVQYIDYINWLKGQNEEVQLFNEKDIPYLYWTAAGYAGAILSSRGDPTWVIQLPRVGRLLESALSLNPDWNKGALYNAMISYTMTRHDPPPNKVEVAEEYFKKAIEASNGLDLGPYVTMAESVCITEQDKNNFTNLLYQALSIDINGDPDLRLTNYINQNRAQWLLDNINEFFY